MDESRNVVRPGVMITPMAAYIPPGWPTGVHPPGSEDFEATAIAWLLDVVPRDARASHADYVTRRAAGLPHGQPRSGRGAAAARRRRRARRLQDRGPPPRR